MGRWSPLFCCFLFYNARTGTKILLHLEIVQYIVAGTVLFVLDFVAQELKNFFATHKNIYYEAYQQNRIQTFKIFIYTCLIMLFSVAAGIIALQKKKPVLLIPYFLYSIFKTGVTILLSLKFYSRRNDIIAKLEDIAVGYQKASSSLGFVAPENPDEDQVTLDLIRYAVYAILSLLIALAISNVHFIQVILECFYDMIKRNRRERRTSSKLKSNGITAV